MTDRVCPNCGGEGAIITYETVWECCNQYLLTGECCASIYGQSNLVPQPVEVESICEQCLGWGEIGQYKSL